MKFLIASFFMLFSVAGRAEIKIGEKVPSFSGIKGSDGKSYSLKELLKNGRPVVFEWFNFDCPYVVKHYHSKYRNMQTLQESYAGKDKKVTWVTVNSAYLDHSSYKDSKAVKKEFYSKKGLGAKSSVYLFDESGELAGLFGAKTTPHLFIVSKEGNLLYEGGVDSLDSTDPSEIADVKNVPYFKNAINEVLSGQKVTKASPPEYGCSVKVKPKS